MPTWEKLDEIDVRLEHPLQKSPTYVAQKMGAVHVNVYFISREELSTCYV
jgi:hypothetical protein